MSKATAIEDAIAAMEAQLVELVKRHPDLAGPDARAHAAWLTQRRWSDPVSFPKLTDGL